MSDHPPVIEAADAFLERLAALDLRAAQHVNACLLDTVDAAEVASFSLAYARVSRCLRQTLALHSKLKIDRERAAREAARHEAATRPVGGAAPAFDLRAHAVDERFDALRNAVDRVISRTADGDEARHTELAHRFDRELDDWVEAPDFLDLEVETHIQAACRRLGLPQDLARIWRHLPEPTFYPDPEEDDADDDAGTAASATASNAERPGHDLRPSGAFDPPIAARDSS